MPQQNEKITKANCFDILERTTLYTRMTRPKLRKGQDTEGKRQLKELLFPDDISVNNWHKFEKVKSENVNRTLW